jgi:NAD(P)H-hydrate epimerase
MSTFPTFKVNPSGLLAIKDFVEMDRLAMSDFGLSIELLMENAGLRLAELATKMVPAGGRILIGVGPGNNGGGGLVAARRLAAWGYKVHLDESSLASGELRANQWDRAIKMGVRAMPTEQPQLYIDAWFGFSQRLPLPKEILVKIQEINALECPRLALDLPTGFDPSTDLPFINANIILTLAAPKKELIDKRIKAGLFIADLGFPKKLYDNFDIDTPPFHVSGILGWKN